MDDLTEAPSEVSQIRRIKQNQNNMSVFTSEYYAQRKRKDKANLLNNTYNEQKLHRKEEFQKQFVESNVYGLKSNVDTNQIF
jgi:hypothetical protein